jgi:hypothetical protein
MNEINLSLHEFRLLVESQYNKFTDGNYIKIQEDMLKSSGIDPDFNNIKSNEIRQKCRFLGENGWVISPFWEPNINETWYDTWFWLTYEGKSDLISNYFEKDNYSLLKQVNGYSRFEVTRYDWFIEAEKLFEAKYYTSCSMVLTAILEASIRECPIDDWTQKITVFFDRAVRTKVEDYYTNKSIEPLSRYIDTVLLLPSIDGFIEMYFNSGARFEKKNEPPYLERNWLMHGMTKRKINEADCIKLFNVICSLHYVKHSIFGTFYGH